jgi:hypothetical protein
MKVVVALLAMLALEACSSSRVGDPVGPGTGINELKRSPCACFEIPMKLPTMAELGQG